VPSEATATIDVRLLPDEDPGRVLATMRQLVNDPTVEVRFAARDGAPRPPGGTRLDTEAFRAIEAAVRKHYQTTVLPTMGVGANDMAQVRAKGVNCYGVGPATDVEDAGKGFGSHSDQERILESELYRFGRFYLDVVTEIARAR
jgi:acetylornithine deacetylase/succinyl-diaminopimelate desuccinylase-like protein